VKHGKISFALFVEDIAGVSFSTFQLTPARTQRPTAFRTVARPAVSCNFNRLPRTCISVEFESESRNYREFGILLRGFRSNRPLPPHLPAELNSSQPVSVLSSHWNNYTEFQFHIWSYTSILHSSLFQCL
jgi:hypothetical protein